MKNPAIILMFILIACHQEVRNEQALIHKNDFESLLGWTDTDAGRLVKGTAHSGIYSALTDSLHAYSIGFIRKMKDLSDQRIKKITMSAWVLTKSLDAKALLVISIESGGKPSFYRGINVIDSIQATDRWYPVRCDFSLPGDLSNENEIRIYLWNYGKDEVLVDDFDLKFYN